MTELYPIIFATVAFLIISGVELLLMKYLNRRWWNIRYIRIASDMLPLSGMVFIVVWIIGLYSMNKIVMLIGATMTALALILIIGLLMTLPISGVINFADRIIDRYRQKNGVRKSSGISRRSFLKTSAAAFPAAAILSGTSGITHAFKDVNVYTRQVYYENLPDSVEGLKILHISDIHLGYYVWLENIEALLEEAGKFSPDIVVLTGDLSDRIEIYTDLLKLFEQFKAPLGVYACLGNHEYFRGITQVRRAFDQSDIPLLVDGGLSVPCKKGSIYIAGADDPRFMHGGYNQFFIKSMGKFIGRDNKDDFRILLSHRPNIFDFTAPAGFDLILSGHTHGGQIGLFERSIFESTTSKKYLWGLYESGASRLYTSSGVGHWFPFRLGCPAEAPVIELRRGLMGAHVDL